MRLRLGGPGVGWVALGWGEPVIAWWGRPEHRGRPSWRGWGGPRFGNKQLTPEELGRISYRNAGVPHAIVFGPGERFGREHVHVGYSRLGHTDDLVPARGELPFKPGPGSLNGGAGRGVRPPARFLDRPVVAVHPAPEIRRPWRVETPGDRPAPKPEARFVTPPKQPWTDLPRPNFGSQGGAERQRRPTPPRFETKAPPASPPAPPPSPLGNRERPVVKVDQAPPVGRVDVPRHDAGGGPAKAPPPEAQAPRGGRGEARLPGRSADQTYRAPEGRGDRGDRGH